MGIEKTFPGTKAKKGLGDLPAHLLWMLNEIYNTNNSDKASRWIGYVCRSLEDLNIFNNLEIRFIIRSNDPILRHFIKNEIPKNVEDSL